MIGAMEGDIIGSIYEHWPIKSKDFPLFDGRCRFTGYCQFFCVNLS